MNEINRLEKNSILYYQGGGPDIALSPENSNLREFYNVENSYIVINALLMPGISNEKARLIEEGKKVAPSMFQHMDELVKVYCRLYSAMCKYTYLYEHEDKYHTYRADRMNTLEYLNQDQMYSFMSTNNCNNKNKDFHGKDGILLLEVEAQGNIEHVDVNAVLEKESKYPHEQEILFAPFALLDKVPLEMTEAEMRYRDIHGNPPEAKYLLHLRLSSIIPCEEDMEEELEELYQEVTAADSMKVVRQVWEIFMSGKEPEEDTTQYYINWKEKLQTYLRMCFARIKYEVTARTPEPDREYGVNYMQDADKRQDEDGGQSIGEERDGDGVQGADERQGKGSVQGADGRSDKVRVQGIDYSRDINNIPEGGVMQDFRKQLSKLEKDIGNYYDYTNEKRKTYRRCVQVVNVIVSVLYPLTTLFVALSLMENLQVFMKMAGLLTSAMGAIAPLVAKGFAWNEKLQQRTATYMKLDRLIRDMEYDQSLDENSLDKYVKRYNAIVDEDNKMGLANALIMGRHSEGMTKESEKKQEMDNGEKE